MAANECFVGGVDSHQSGRLHITHFQIIMLFYAQVVQCKL